MEDSKLKRPQRLGVDSEIRPDAWSRFERAVDVVAKSPPQHRAKARGKSGKSPSHKKKAPPKRGK